jgi:hypothetical protein
MGTKYNPTVVRDGLIYYLDAANPRCYSGSGLTIYDLVSSSIGGTLVNGTGFSTAQNGLLLFDGSNDSIISANRNIPFTSNSNFTIETLVKFNSNLVAYQTVFLYGTKNQSKVIILSKSPSTINNGYLYGGVYDGTNFISIGSTYNGTQIVNLGYIHCVLTVDKPSANFVAKIYLNGEINNTSGTAITSYSLSSLDFFGISSGGDFSEFVNGSIGFLKFYNRALTAQEVLQNYNATKKRYI